MIAISEGVTEAVLFATVWTKFAALLFLGVTAVTACVALLDTVSLVRSFSPSYPPVSAGKDLCACIVEPDAAIVLDKASISMGRVRGSMEVTN